MSTQHLQNALMQILKSNRLDVAKEIAADALDVDVNEFTDEDEIESGTFSDEDNYDNIYVEDVLSMFE